MVNSLVLQEKIDKAALRWIITNIGNISRNIEFGNNGYDLSIVLNKLYNSTNEDGIHTATYKTSDKSPNGRLFVVGGIGLQSLDKRIRHTICRNIYIDIDMENAHPVILEYICNINKIQCPCLKKYIQTRNDYISKIIEKNPTYNRGMIKAMILAMINNGHYDYDTLPNKPKWLINLFNELQYINIQLTTIYKNNYNNAIVNTLNNKKPNPKGTFISTLLSEYEARCLMLAVKFLQTKGYTVGVLMFDGFMVEKHDAITPELLNELSVYIYNTINMNIKFTIKEMTEGFVLPENYNETTRTVFDIEDDSDNNIGEVVYKVLYTRFKFVPGNIWYKFINNVWKETTVNAVITAINEDIISVYKAKAQSTNIDLYKKILDKLKNFNTLTRIVKYSEHLFNDEEFKEKLNSKKHLIAFNNGVLDLQSLSFRPTVYDDYISITTGYDWCHEDNEEIQNFLKQFMIDILDTDEDNVEDLIYDEETDLPINETINENKHEMSDYMWKVLAYTLASTRYLEQVWIWTGKGGNGKSCLTTLLRKSLGDNYSLYTGSSVLMHNPKTALSPEMAQTINKRVIVTSEPDENDTFKGNIIKAITTNNGVLTIRDIYEKPRSIPIEFTVIIECNDIPDISNVDGGIVRRLNIVKFPYNFVENPIDTKKHKKIDYSLSDKLNNVAYRQQFMRLLFHYYKEYIHGKQHIATPRRVNRLTDNYISETSSVEVWLQSKYEFGLDKGLTSKNRIKKCELFQHFRSYSRNNNYTARKFYSAIDKINGIDIRRYNNTTYYIYIKEKSLFIEDTTPSQ